MAAKKKKKVTGKPKYRKPPSNILEVKRKHIIAADKAGGRNDPCNCPIGQALQERFPGMYVGVDDTVLQVGNVYRAEDELRYKATKKAVRFMERYDSTGKAEPTRLRLVKLSEESW